jgi:NitT/TauT family transport system substrate-binding protein
MRRHASNRPNRHSKALIGALIVLAAACGQQGPTPDQAQPAPSTDAEADDAWTQEGGPLFVGRSTNNIADTAVLMAIEEGWFEQAGLDVELVEAATLIDLFPLLVAGDVSVMFMAITPTLFAGFIEGVPMRIPATTLVNRPDECSATGMLADAETWLKVDPSDPQTTRGLRIGGNFTSLASARYLDALTTKWGITPAELELVQLTTDTHVAALADDQVDAVFTFEPILTVGPSRTDAIAVEPGAELLAGDVNGVLAMGERLLEDRELAARYLAVYLRAMERLSEGATAENVALIAVATGIDPATVASMCIQPQSADGRPHEARLTEMWEYAVARGDVDRVVPPGEVWDHDLLDRARELLESGEIVLSD